MRIEVRRLLPPPVLFMFCLCAASIGERMKSLPIATYDFKVGIALGVLGCATAGSIALWGIAELKRHHTTVEPGHTPTRLVTTGPFRFSRNPLYLSLLLITLGLAVAVNSLWLVFASVVLFLLLDRFVVRREEAVIQEAFGEEYAKYRAGVRRWL